MSIDIVGMISEGVPLTSVTDVEIQDTISRIEFNLATAAHDTSKEEIVAIDAVIEKLERDRELLVARPAQIQEESEIGSLILAGLRRELQRRKQGAAKTPPKE